MKFHCATLALLFMVPAVARATELRELCPDRPGKATPACTLDPGHAEYETSLADWTHYHATGATSDIVLVADSLLRVGLTRDTEAQIGWTPWGHMRERDFGGTIRDSGIGDVTLSLRHNLRNPDGSGFSIAFQPFVSLPGGGKAIGAGDWGAGLIIPASVELPHKLQLGIAPSVEAAVDQDHNGRHLAYSLATALTVPLGDTGLSSSIEFWGSRDDDPSGHASQFSLDASAIWTPKQLANLQLDVGGYVGLNHNTPDLELLGGVAVRF
jgi:hypothetical protein